MPDELEFSDDEVYDPKEAEMYAPEYPRVEPYQGMAQPDLIDFRVSDLWLDYYHARGMTPFSSGR